jgi:hypothetical protein
MDIQHIMDYLPTTYALHQQEVTKTMVDLKLLKEVPIDSSVNQCQGFCYNSKKDVFVLACINSENTRQVIYELDPKTFDIVGTYKFRNSMELAHMNTLTYNPDTNLLYTTNAKVDGHRITTIDADTMIIKGSITIPERVFNLAYDRQMKQFISIVPIDATMRRINYYTSQFQLIRSKDIDANHDDFNNNGAFADGGNTIFATLSTVVTVDKTGNVAKISSFPKNLEIEDMDMRNHMMYAAVNMNHKVFIYTMLNY